MYLTIKEDKQPLGFMVFHGSVSEFGSIGMSEHFNIFKFKFYFMCMGLLPACIFVYHIWTWCPGMTEEGVGSPGTEVTESYEMSHPCLEQTLCPLEEQPMLLTTLLFL